MKLMVEIDISDDPLYCDGCWYMVEHHMGNYCSIFKQDIFDGEDGALRCSNCKLVTKTSQKK